KRWLVATERFGKSGRVIHPSGLCLRHGIEQEKILWAFVARPREYRSGTEPQKHRDEACDHKTSNVLVSSGPLQTKTWHGASGPSARPRVRGAHTTSARP